MNPRPLFTKATATVTAAAGIACLLSAPYGSADDEEEPPPSPEELAWIDELSVIPPGQHLDLKPLSIRFDLSWNNVLNAGEMAMNLARETPEDASIDPVFVGTASGKSNGLARVLWPYDFEAKALVDPNTLQPHLFELTETERQKTTSYNLDFQPGKLISETTVHPKKETEESKTKRKVYRYNAIRDVLSIALYLRSLDVPEGESITALVSPFNRPYHVELTMAGEDTRKIKWKKYDTLKYDVAIRKVNHNQTLQTYDKMKKATIWFSDDEFRLPIEVHADIFVGFVSARMKERKWTKETPLASSGE